MAGTAESKVAAARRQVASPVPYLEYDEFVEVQIAKTRDSLRSNEVITALTQLAVLWVGYLLLVVILDHWVVDRGLSPQVRMILLLGLIALSGFITFRHILWPLFRRIHPLYAARVIEESESQFQGNLVNWIDLKEAGRASETSAAVRAIEKRAAVGLDRIDVDTAVDRRPLMRAAYALLGVVVMSAMYVAFSPKDPFSSVHRALLPLSATGVSTETTISDITPGDLEVTARSQVTVEADLRGKAVERAQILLTTADRKFVDQPVDMRRIESGLPRFRGVLNGENGRGLLQDVDYRIVANDAQSETFHIRVIQPPSAQIEKLTYTYPPYMQLEPRQVPGPAIEAWEGTKVTFEGRTNLPVSQARLILTDTEQGTQGEEVSLRIEGGTQLSGSWTLAFRSDGTAPRFYHVAVKTPDGSIDPNPVRIPIEVRADQRPEVALLFPTSDLEKPANAIIPLAIAANDPDFQLRSLTLKSERNGTPLPDQPLFESEFPTRTIERTWEWDLGRLGLQPGERVQYWIEARDNRQPIANRTNTPRLSLLIQDSLGTEQEVQRDLADARQQLADDLAAMKPPAGAADRPQGDEPTEENSGDPRAAPEEQVAQRAETGDRDPLEPTDARDPDERQDTDEQTEFQNQLERLLNREERTQDLANRAPQEGQSESNQADDNEGNASRQESDGNAGDSGSTGTKSDSTGNKTANRPNPSSTNSGRKDETKARGESGTESSTGEPGEGRENDSDDKPNPAESARPKPDRANPPGNSKTTDSSRGSKPSDSSPNGSDDEERPEPGTPPQKSGSKRDRSQPGTAPQRDKQTGSDGSSDSMEEQTQTKSTKANPGDTEADSGQDEKQNPAETEDEPGSAGSPPDNSSKKPSKPKGTNPKPSSVDGENSSSRNERDKGQSNSEGAGDDEEEPSATDAPSNSNEPPSGERPPRPGQESRSKSKPQKSTPSESEETEGSDNTEGQDSAGQGDSQQSGQSPGKPGKPQGSSGQPQSGSQGEMKSNPGNADSSDSQDSGAEKPQRSQSKPSGASKAPSQSGAGKNSSSTSNPSSDRPPSDRPPSDRPMGDEAGGSEQESDEATEPNSDDGARNPRGESSDPDRGSSKPKQQSKSRSGNSQGKSTPSEGDSDPQGKQPGESQEHEDPPSERDAPANSARNPTKRPNNPSEVGNQRPKGQGRPQGQQSQQPEAGEQGRSSASDQGEGGGQQEGAGESTDEAGDSQPTNQKTGQSGKSPGTSRKGAGNSPSGEGDSRTESSSPSKAGKPKGTQPNAGKPGSNAAEGSDSENESEEGAEGDSGNSPNDSNSAAGKPGTASGSPSGQSGQTEGQSPQGSGEQGPSSKSGKSDSASSGRKAGGGAANGQSSQAGEPSGTSSGQSGQSGAGRLGDGARGDRPAREGAGSPVGRGIPEGDGPGEGTAGSGNAGSDTPPPTGEPKLDELKEASNLILQRLKGQLSRGDVDEETLQELGWKDLGQLKKFVSRLEEGLADSPDDMSPEAQARRRQFEEILKSLKLDAQTETRERGNGTERRVDQVDAGRRPVPSSLRERYEAYTRSLSKQGSSGKKDAKSPVPPPRSGQSR